MPEDLADLRARAWVGDAVLALVAREWILTQPDIKPEARAEEFIALTSNDFLACVGEPTRVEATIGELYQQNGLATARAHIEATLLPLYRKQRRNRR